MKQPNQTLPLFKLITTSAALLNYALLYTMHWEVYSKKGLLFSEVFATESLRRNPPEVRVTSGQTPSTKIIYIVLQTSVGLF